MADVFISYSKKDRALAEMIDGALRASGFTTWWDNALVPAEAWEARLVEEIESASVIMVLWTQHALASEFVRDEAEKGRRFGKLVPVRFADVEPPLGHGQIQMGDLIGWTGNVEDRRWQQVIQAATSIRNGGVMRQATGGRSAKPRSATAELVVSSPYAGPAVPPPKTGERWEKVELPASLQKLWSRGPAKYGSTDPSWWGHTQAAWNDRAKEPLLGFCNQGKVGFLRFPGSSFTSRLLFNEPFYKEYWQFPVCVDWAHLDSDEFVFVASCGVGTARPGGSYPWLDRDGKRIYNERISGHSFGDKRVFGLNDRMLFVDGRKASINVGVYQPASFELPYSVDRFGWARLCISASSKFAVLSTAEHPIVLHFPDNMLRSYDYHIPCEVEVYDIWRTFEGGTLDIRGFAFSWHPTRDILAALSHTVNEKNSIAWRIWLMDAAGKPIAPAMPIDHRSDLTELDWSSTGRFVAVSSEDHSLSLWDLSTGEVRRLFGHTGPVRRVQFSPDGQRLASIDDKEAIIWHPETGDRIASWQANGPSKDTLRGKFWAPDARMIATTSSNGLEIRRLVI